MKKKLKLITAFMLVLTMIFQVNMTFGATNIPSEVLKADGYKKIPVVYNGKEVSQVDVALQKVNTTAQNANERFNISGTATFYIDSYVYKTGSNIKMGTLFTYKDEDGNWVEDWLDQSGQIGSDANWQSTDYKVNVDPIQFMELTSQATNKRVNFITTVMNGSNKVGNFKRESSKNVAISTADVVVTQDGLTISKTTKVVEDQKNVWEVEVKVEGQNIIVDEATDVVLVLDKSGSMGQGVLGCGLEEHKHSYSCYSGWGSNRKLTCTKQEHTHSGDCYILKCTNTSATHKHTLPGDFIADACYLSRADKVKDASYSFLDTLEEKDNVNINVVTYAGSASAVTNTNLKTGIQSAYSKLGTDGTNTGEGIKSANAILAKSKAPNKMIVVLSDGESNAGNSKTYADTAKKAGYVVYTIGAGIASNSSGATELKNCASIDTVTKEAKFYLADDTSNALQTIFMEIAGEIKEAGSKCVMSEALTNEFQIVMDKSLANSGAEQVTLNDLSTINWKNKNVIYTQGAIQKAETDAVKWDIGKLEIGTPAILRYRIRMASGKLGIQYPISSESKIEYLDSEGNNKVLSLPAIKKSALFAGIKFNIHQVNKDGSESLISTGTVDEAWVKVPEDTTKLGNLKVSLLTKVDEDNREVELTGSTTLAEICMAGLGTSPSGATPKLLGSKVAPGDYREEKEELLTDVTNPLDTYVGDLELSATMGNGYNYIQPEGVTNVGGELKVNGYSKDVTYKVNLSNIIDEQMNGKAVVKLDIAKATIGVEKLTADDGTNKTWTAISSSKYAFSEIPKAGDRELTIKFEPSFTISTGEVYRVIIYAPTHMEESMKYNEYLSTYINDTTNNTRDVQVTVKASTRTKEAVTIDGVYYPEQYAELTKNLTIQIKFLEMASIH